MSTTPKTKTWRDARNATQRALNALRPGWGCDPTVDALDKAETALREALEAIQACKSRKANDRDIVSETLERR